MTWEELKSKFPDTLLDKSTIDEQGLEKLGISADVMYFKLLDEMTKNFIRSKFWPDLYNQKMNFKTNPVEIVAIEVFERHFDEVKDQIFTLFEKPEDIIKYIEEKS